MLLNDLDEPNLCIELLNDLHDLAALDADEVRVAGRVEGAGEDLLQQAGNRRTAPLILAHLRVDVHHVQAGKRYRKRG